MPDPIETQERSKWRPAPGFGDRLWGCFFLAGAVAVIAVQTGMHFLTAVGLWSLLSLAIVHLIVGGRHA